MTTKEQGLATVNVPEIATVEGAQDKPTPSIDTFIEQAIATKAPIETLERLFDLQQKAKAAHAKAEFIKSMSALQEVMPVVKKLKKGHVATYAPLEDIVEIEGPFIRKHGFAYRWDTKQEGSEITVKCIATHTLGHSEIASMTAPVEETVTGNTSGKATKSGPQRVASTITFLKRYTFVNLFGIQVAGEDFDGRVEKQHQKQKPMVETAKAMIRKLQDTDKLLDTQELIANSDKYTDAEKKELVALIKEELAKLK